MKIVAALALAAVAISIPSGVPVRADLVISESTVINCPGMKSMLQEIPDASRAPLLKMLSPMLTGAPWVTTTYLKDNHLRTDMGQTTILVNSVTGNEVTMNNQTHTYSIGPYDPFQKAAGNITCVIQPTSQRATMLGHVVNRYLVTMTSSVLPKSQISGDIWSAPDLPTPPSIGYSGGLAAGFESQMSKVKGMPLAYRLLYTNTPCGNISVMSYATSIDTALIPYETFRIPDSFHKGTVQTATVTPSAGFPLGDGVPLDSSGPVTDDMIGLGGGDSSDLSGLLGSMSGGGSGGMSASALSGLLGAAGGQSGGTASAGTGAAASSLGNLINPQMLKQLQQELQALTSGDSGD
jgi:hypothetical protein